MNRIGQMLNYWSSDHQVDSGTSEFSFVLHPEGGDSFDEQIRDLEKGLNAALESKSLTKDTIIFCRFFLSDIANQVDALRNSTLYDMFATACSSIVGQAPLGAGLLALQVYCMKGADLRKDVVATVAEDGYSGIRLFTGTHEVLWTGGMSSNNPAGSLEQTDEIFPTYVSLLETYGFKMNPDTIRTWIFVHDVDRNYAGMVTSRLEYFKEHNLTKETNYIASTGIQARLPGEHSLVTMDTVAVKNLDSEQVVFMEAPDNMCPTHVYDVTFERGTKVAFGDRDHMYISGTASIDTQGNVLHIGDVSLQTDRTLDNVQALLTPHGADFSDFSYLLIYLRNPLQYRDVRNVVDRRVPSHIPRLYLHGPVCRPTWLVEIEGVAIKKSSHSRPGL